jgi:hypothetical protein
MALGAVMKSSKRTTSNGATHRLPSGAKKAQTVLGTELKVYRKRLPELLANENKFVVIHGDAVRVPFDTYEAALKAGYDEFGLKPFLVKQVRKKEPIYFL